MSNRLHSDAGESYLVPLFFVCYLDTYHPMCDFLSVWRFLLLFVCLWTPAFYKMCDFLPPDPALISLLIPRYLPAVTLNLSDMVYIIYKITGI